jgi:hypothetical protein
MSSAAHVPHLAYRRHTASAATASRRASRGPGFSSSN